MQKILVVDDDPQLRQSFERILQQEGYQVLTASSAETGVESVRQHGPDMVIMDFRLPGMTGIEGFKEIKKIDAKLPVIIMTAFGTTDTAIEATKLGAFDYVIKPFEIPDILSMIQKALAAGRFMRSKVHLDGAPESSTDQDVIIGRSKPMQDVYKSIGRVAPTDATVLIRGESGTGKELAARAIYQHSLRNERPFLVINCVAIPETLLESELFGYEKGAFTGATTRRVGKIEQANGGTVFLDEIGEMDLSLQVKILRVLQEREFERVGGSKTIKADVRVVAATNRDLEEEVSKGAFREDLFYRLNVIPLTLPPLRDRGEDVLVLAHYFLKNFCTNNRPQILTMAEEVANILARYSWPGNVRELENFMERMSILCDGECIGVVDLPDKILRETGVDVPKRPVATLDTSFRWPELKDLREKSMGLKDFLDNVEERLLSEALGEVDGVKNKAAEILGIKRTTLIEKLKKKNML